MSYPFQLKNVYNFEVYPSPSLGTGFQNVTVLAILDYETALQSADIPAMHVNVYPHLPAGTPDDPSQYDYIRIRTQNGATTILGIPWINLDTLELRQSMSMTVTIEDVGSVDLERVRLALVQNGYNNIKLTLNSRGAV